jgi:outer membrane autotransporter protein
VSVSGLSINVAGQTVPLEAMTAVLTSGPGGGASADPPTSLGGLGIFLNGQGTFGDQNGSTLEPGFKFHTEGLTLGTDYRVSANFVLGAAAGYLHTTSTLDEAGGRVKLSGYSVSAFGSYYQADRFYVDAIATYGWNDFGVSRNVVFGDTSARAKSDPDGRQLTLSMSAGYNVNVGALTFGPTARATYIDVRIDGFQERGADLFNLRVNSQRVESLATDLGAQLSYAISLPWGVLSPLARAEWEHEFKGGSRVIAGSLVADPLRTLFGAPTNAPDRNYVNLAAGLTATLPRGASAFAHYETVLGRDRVTTHSFTAGLRFQFE